MFDDMNEKKLSPKSKYIDNMEKEILESFKVNIDLISKIFNQEKDFKNSEKKNEYYKLKSLIIEKKTIFINNIICYDKNYDIDNIEKLKLKNYATNINKYLLIIENLILDLKNGK